MIPNLTGKSNTLFESLRRRRLTMEEVFEYFHFEFKKTCNVGKSYLLPNIHKRLSNLPGWPVISNFWAYAGKFFWQSHTTHNDLPNQRQIFGIAMVLRVLQHMSYREQIMKCDLRDTGKNHRLEYLSFCRTAEVHA